MERGVIEGAEWINCLEDKKLGLHKVAKYYYTPGMHEPVTGGQMVFKGTSGPSSRRPAGDGQGGERLRHDAAQLRLQPRDRRGLQDLIKEGVQIHRTPDDILKNFLDKWEKIQAEYAPKDPFYAR